ncbi:MAG: hypothetical protein K6A43_00945 [Treponema sp.]|nr:hypothetical protein [Treponema sp.]
MCKKHVRFLHSFLALKKTRPICVAAIAVFVCMLLCACANNVDSMIEDYNGHFVVEVEDTFNVQNENFNPKYMLLSEYGVHYTTTLCLSAPSGGVGYEWKVTLVEAADEEAIVGEEIILGNSRFLTIYLRDSNVRRWAQYTLTLTVLGANNTEFVDTAELNVY